MARFTVDFPDTVLPSSIATAKTVLSSKGVPDVENIPGYVAVGMMLAMYLGDVTAQHARNTAQQSVQPTLDQAEQDAKDLAENFAQLTITPITTPS